MSNLVKKVLVIALIAVAQTVAEEVLAKPFRRKRNRRLGKTATVPKTIAHHQ